MHNNNKPTRDKPQLDTKSEIQENVMRNTFENSVGYFLSASMWWLAFNPDSCWRHSGEGDSRVPPWFHNLWSVSNVALKSGFLKWNYYDSLFRIEVASLYSYIIIYAIHVSFYVNIFFA